MERFLQRQIIQMYKYEGNMLIAEIRILETAEAIRAIDTGKAWIDDGIALIKYLNQEGVHKEAWYNRKIPKNWQNNLIMVIYEKRE